MNNVYRQKRNMAQRENESERQGGREEEKEEDTGRRRRIWGLEDGGDGGRGDQERLKDNDDVKTVK